MSNVEDISGDSLFGENTIEPEDVVGEDRIESPFDPTKIRVDTRPLTIDLIVTRLREEEIDLRPAFQRKKGIWKDEVQSRLIESILIRIPLPAFYMDATVDDKWVVIDGLQRLTTLERFIINKDLKLTGLEFLSQLNHKGYDDLPRGFQRRILETQITAYLINRGTPDTVKFTIFRRINTGGVPLSPQEIRHALNQGKSTDILTKMSQDEIFRSAIDNGVPSERMGDQELILRFFAFTITSYKSYFREDFDAFLNRIMQKINEMTNEECEKLSSDFLRSMKWCSKIFEKYAFRKQFRNISRRQPINKALFEAWSVNIHKLNDQQLQEVYIQRKNINHLFIELMEKDTDFVNSISFGTGDVRKVRYRFEKIEQLIRSVIV